MTPHCNRDSDRETCPLCDGRGDLPKPPSPTPIDRRVTSVTEITLLSIFGLGILAAALENLGVHIPIPRTVMIGVLFLFAAGLPLASSKDHRSSANGYQRFQPSLRGRLIASLIFVAIVGILLWKANHP